MKKFAKLSLVAAVAVTGLTNANATALEEAIKGVDVSGSVVYRYDDRKADDVANNPLGKNSGSNSYKAVVNVKSPIYDDMSANLSVAAGNNFATLNTTDGGNADTNVATELTKANFAYTGIMNTTVIAGKQGLATPWTVASDSDNNEQTGTGALALTTIGAVTAAAGYFNQTNLNTVSVAKLDGTDDIVVAALMGNAGPVALEAWYLDLADTFDTYTLSAKGEFKAGDVKLTPSARYTNLELDNVTTDNSMISGELKAKYDIFGGAIAYGTTDKDGGLVALDNDADAGFQGWVLDLNGKADSNLLKLNANVQAIKQLNVALNYNILKNDSAKDTTKDVAKEETELYTQLTWTPSKNFTSYARLGQYNATSSKAGEKDYDSTIGRIQAEYKF